MALISFVTGAWIVNQLPALPGTGYLLTGFLTLSASWLICRKSTLKWLMFACAGFGYAVIYANDRLDARLPSHLEGKDLVLTGTVTSLPRVDEHAVRFRFTLDASDCRPGDECWQGNDGALIDLAWYRPDHQRVVIMPGQRWQVTVRLNRPHGSVNAGLFDYEGWLLSEGITARGYIRSGDREPRLLDNRGARMPVLMFRYWLRTQLLDTVGDALHGGLIIALVLGESSEIKASDWRTLSDTGTNHLLIISGLHVGLVAVASYRLLATILGLWMLDSRRYAGLLSLTIALGYGLIAGMGLPVQRALVMTAVALSGTLLNRHIAPASMFCYALFLVTVFDPMASLRAGFWLSFGAVFALVYGFAGRRPVRPDQSVPGRSLMLAKVAVRTQWVVYIGTAPLLCYLVFQVSLVAWLVNLIAIPWISLSVIPVLLLSIAGYLVSPATGAVLVHFALQSLAGLWSVLEYAANLRWVFYAGALSPVQVSAGVLGALLLLSPRGFLPRWLGVPLLVPIFAIHSPDYADGEIELKVFDVGQGLAVTARTRDLLLLYDAGPRFGSGFDAGEQIVVPSLRLSGRSRFIEWFVVSHWDTDHAGGAAAVHDSFVIGSAFAQTSVAGSYTSCHEAQPFTRNGITYRFIPILGDHLPGNDRSCVLLIESDGFAILLPGDIGSAGESQLSHAALPDAGIDVLIAPHHGSRSSSSPAFLNLVRPRVVIFSSGYNNRFNHPDPVVVDRYRLRRIRTFNTAKHGQITIRYTPGEEMKVEVARSAHRRFWYDGGIESDVPD
ncbi:MAG: DNA internalization-related competence protein ComEC/Rec2 [Pseudomonadales bacterium]